MYISPVDALKSNRHTHGIAAAVNLVVVASIVYLPWLAILIMAVCTLLSTYVAIKAHKALNSPFLYLSLVQDACDDAEHKAAAGK